MTRKPRDPMHFTREAQRLMRKSQLMQFLRGEGAPDTDPPSEQPAAPPSPPPPPPPTQKRGGGRKPRYRWDVVQRLFEQHPLWSHNEIQRAYSDETGEDPPAPRTLQEFKKKLGE
jgi:hypothetical protein